MGKEDARERLGALATTEARAASIRAYNPVLVPGLLQTENYMRHQFSAGLFQGATEADIDDLVEARLKRQSVLDRLRSYLVLLDESILRRSMGSRDIAREQFELLIGMARRPKITIQIIPFSAAAYPAAGPMTILDLADGGQAVHVDGPASGTTTTEPRIVQVCMEQFEMVRSHAASVPDSAAMIHDRIKELR